MRKVGGMCCAVAAAGVLASASGDERAASARSAGVAAPYENAKFVPIDPARPDAAQIAVLRGDPATGPSSMLMKMKKGPGVLHYHTSHYELVVVEGRMRHWVEGQAERDTPELGPGSYWNQPGMKNHGDSCLSDMCVMFITWSGKRDGFMAQQR